MGRKKNIVQLRSREVLVPVGYDLHIRNGKKGDMILGANGSTSILGAGTRHPVCVLEEEKPIQVQLSDGYIFCRSGEWCFLAEHCQATPPEWNEDEGGYETYSGSEIDMDYVIRGIDEWNTEICFQVKDGQVFEYLTRGR